MEEEFERKLTLSESNEERISDTTTTTSASNVEEKTIEFSPFYDYEHFTEEEILENMILVHEHYFQWKCVEGKNKIAEEFFKKNKYVSFDRLQHPKKKNSFKWTNKIPIDLTKLSSVHRILVIRDITHRLLDEKKERLRLLDEKKDDKANKMLTGSGDTTVNFQLDGITFSLELMPSKNQPGNARLTMQRTTGQSRASRHVTVEKFDCFKNLEAKDIDSIVSHARKTGKKITDSDITNSEQDQDRKKMAEDLNFFMLLYDFEVARRLQRPFTEESRNLDSLPIGIGIAMIHRINGKRETWDFFSSIFQKDWKLRKDGLDKIVEEFEKRCKKPSEVGTGAEHINERLLNEQFGSQE